MTAGADILASIVVEPAAKQLQRFNSTWEVINSGLLRHCDDASVRMAPIRHCACISGLHAGEAVADDLLHRSVIEDFHKQLRTPANPSSKGDLGERPEVRTR
jgi:hypothetical protein